MINLYSSLPLIILPTHLESASSLEKEKDKAHSLCLVATIAIVGFLVLAIAFEKATIQRRVMLKNGVILEGKIKGLIHPILNGRGRMALVDGTHKEGEFRNNQMHGLGVVSKNGEIRLKGTFRNDQLCGEEGFLLDDEGVVRTGVFVGGKLEGKGKTLYSEGEYDEGEFKNNRLNGVGISVSKEKSFIITRKGVFRDGKLNCTNGSVTKTNSEGFILKAFIGEFKDNLLHGEGKVIFSDKTEYSGRFEYGEEIGLIKITDRNGNSCFKNYEKSSNRPFA